MTPEDKAKELYDKFNLPSGMMSAEVKQCALIAAEEVLDALYRSHGFKYEGDREYWQDVKSELEKL